MTTELYNEFLSAFDKEVCAHGLQKALIMVDNAPSHVERPATKLARTKVVFLPPNTTSKMQPLDGGIIKTFKTLYRTQLVRLLDEKEDRKDNTAVSIGEALLMLD